MFSIFKHSDGRLCMLNPDAREMVSRWLDSLEKTVSTKYAKVDTGVQGEASTTIVARKFELSKQ
eukprot:920176-Lingulodinium_polyedra.AAC.1